MTFTTPSPTAAGELHHSPGHYPGRVEVAIRCAEDPRLGVGRPDPPSGSRRRGCGRRGPPQAVHGPVGGLGASTRRVEALQAVHRTGGVHSPRHRVVGRDDGLGRLWGLRPDSPSISITVA
jgi:hypothetical protein